MDKIDHSTFDLPVSLHIFNRPEITKRTFDVIKKIQPKYLFVTADGPRENILEEAEQCNLTRKIIENGIDWDCELCTNYSQHNKGSYKCTSDGISWVFNHVEEAIILEDDCLPNLSFFRFCRELLDYYRNDSRIAMISGNNFLFGKHNIRHSYYFSRYTHMWGWATWKRTWKQVDFAMINWPEFRDMGGLKLIFRRKYEIIYWHEIMQRMFNGEIGPHWDYLLLLSMYMNNTLAIRPSVNLICNTGYGVKSTHFANKSIINEVETKNMTFPLTHPPFICKNFIADELVDLYEFSGGQGQYIKKQIQNVKKQIQKFLPKTIVNFLKKIKKSIFS